MHFLTKSSYMLLGLINRQSRSGYDLKKTIKKMSNFYWSESNAQIYPILKKLEEAKLVKSEIDLTSGKRNRKIYAITSLGKKYLKEWLQTDLIPTPYREELLMQISFGQNISNENFKDKIENYRDEIIKYIKEHQITLQHIKDEHPSSRDFKYLILVYDHSKRILDAKLAWAEQVLKDIK